MQRYPRNPSHSIGARALRRESRRCGFAGTAQVIPSANEILNGTSQSTCWSDKVQPMASGRSE
jgi:hypothetical protein